MRCAVVFAIATLFAIPSLAEETHYDLATTDLVVVGKLDLSSSFPYFDGWHYSGKIPVHEVLWGPAKVGETLNYHFVMSCSSLCDYRVWLGEIFTPTIRRRISAEGVWSLRKAQDGFWTGGNLDPGFRDIRYRAFAVETLARRAQHPSPANVR